MALNFFPSNEEDTRRANQIIDIAVQMERGNLGLLINILFSFFFASATLERKCQNQMNNTNNDVKH